MSPEWVEAMSRYYVDGVMPGSTLTAATRTRIRRDGPRAIHRPVPHLDQVAARTVSPARPPAPVAGSKARQSGGGRRG